jgi:hypothetical protein
VQVHGHRHKGRTGPDRSAPGPTGHRNPEGSVACRDRVKDGQSRPIHRHLPQPKVCPRVRPRRNDATLQRNAAEPSPSAPDHSFTTCLLFRFPHTSRQQPLSPSTRTIRDAHAGAYIFGREPSSQPEADTAPQIEGDRPPSQAQPTRPLGRRPAVLHHLG